MIADNRRIRPYTACTVRLFTVLSRTGAVPYIHLRFGCTVRLRRRIYGDNYGRIAATAHSPTPLGNKTRANESMCRASWGRGERKARGETRCMRRERKDADTSGRLDGPIIHK
jgi:hypothetical protein